MRQPDRVEHGGNGLIYINSPTAGANATSGNGGIPTYQAPSVIPGLLPYNYVQADGNRSYESGFNYETVTGLTAGTTYQALSGGQSGSWLQRAHDELVGSSHSAPPGLRSFRRSHPVPAPPEFELWHPLCLHQQ